MEHSKTNSIDKPMTPVRLRKAIMRTGEFQTPDGARFTIDKTRLDHWVRTFCRMHQNGDVCRIVKDHDEATTSSVGKVVSMERRGDFLYATLEFPTRQLADLSLTNDVSILSEPLYRTGSGTYKDAIKHVSLTPFPLISKLGSFKSLPESAPVGRLTCSINNYVKQQTKGQTTMDESLNQVVELIANFIGLEVPEVARQSNDAAIAWISAILQGANASATKEDEKTEEEKTPEQGEESDKPESDDEDAEEDKDKLPANADAIIASVNGARRSVLNSFVGFPGITAQQVGKWVDRFAKCKTLKKQASTNAEFETLIEGLRCSCNGKRNVVETGKQIGSNASSVKIPAFEKLMALRK